MENVPRFFEKKYVGPETGQLVVEVPEPHWTIWGRYSNFGMVADRVDPARFTNFRIIMRLAKSDAFGSDALIELSLEVVSETGDSFFDISKLGSTIQLSNGSNVVELNLINNKHNRLAGVSTEIINVAFQSAIEMSRQIANYLSLAITVPSSIPCTIDRIFIASGDMQQRYWRTLMPYPIFSFESLRLRSVPAIDPFTSVYAEGIRARSPFYRFLCFFKIVEQIIKSGGHIAALATEYNVARPVLNGMVPSDPFSNLTPQYVGKKYTVLQSELQTRYRNVIAHLDLNSPIQPFQLEAEAEVEQSAIVLSFVARELLFKLYDFAIALAQHGCNLAELRFPDGA